ncbi:hypothetical protein BD410DRAFT_391 [Rickenella mellea]|uniref:Uncharacterized protein n=1 Tax=Rickenella mellea TaxID=50990 RepID=A0A4R5XDG0_9AGAM|nr:hypothetical protein BD410DRAFT_391 [Rickenella mellea]
MFARLNNSAKMSGNIDGPLEEVVAQRCRFALVGHEFGAMRTKGFTQLETPPLENGMMDCVNRVKRIVIERTPGTNRNEYAELPGLFRRIRTLLRVFYDYTMSRTETPDLKYCDFPQVFDVIFTLHQVGLYAQLDPSRLQAMMAEGGTDMETFLLNEPLDVGPWIRYAHHVEQDVEQDQEADGDDWSKANDVGKLANEDGAAHSLIWLIGDLNVAFLLGQPTNNDESRWAGKAMKRLIKWSTDPFYKKVLGDGLTDAMRPIYWNASLLVKFSRAGGIAALYADWADSSYPDHCEEILGTLPEPSWENQTKTSLMAVTREFQNKITLSRSRGLNIVKHPAFLNALHNIHSRYGLAPFQKTAKLETWRSPIIFQFLSHRIKKDGLTFRTTQDWIPLLDEFVHLPSAIIRRYKWLHMSISCRWNCITFYGCDNKFCSE